MSKRTISDIIKQWRKPIKSLHERPKPSQLLQIVEDSPSSLEAKLAVHAHAKILASPLRLCTFHFRQFPNELMIRFEKGWHQPTKLFWAFPTFKKSGGKGVYVNLSRKVLEIFGKGSYRAAFRGSATYRNDMQNHVESLLHKESFAQFAKRPSNTFHILTAKSASQWKANSTSPMGYQCILSFSTSETLCELDHQIESLDGTHPHVPCYHIQRIWDKRDIESIHLPEDDTVVALGVPRKLDTVDLAIALWRCRKFAS
ncbi:uncharacterized protein EV154DRAFT_130030 [Mucor mucedo]|uniref:uncharacterized protein n=1 Tax=Mucor mucedo TaxID=29922 RepID=UPI00222056B5|nr:uncharacterized protein EV154DRAFT_130030 [Mucor mucedo]KAI7869089.1 hypothetical protein EV154DRAFT_130030 [Mucor mucedo]